MRKAFETCHIFALGMGSNRKTGRGGIGCDCAENKIVLTPYEHDCLDFRLTNFQVEHYKVIHREELAEEPKSYRHKLAFAAVFGKEWEIKLAIKHHQERNRGKTLCTKLKK